MKNVFNKEKLNLLKISVFKIINSSNENLLRNIFLSANRLVIHYIFLKLLIYGKFDLTELVKMCLF